MLHKTAFVAHLSCRYLQIVFNRMINSREMEWICFPIDWVDTRNICISVPALSRHGISFVARLVLDISRTSLVYFEVLSRNTIKRQM